MENKRKGKKLFSVWLSELEVKEISKILSNKSLYNEDLALIGAIIYETYERGDYYEN